MCLSQSKNNPVSTISPAAEKAFDKVEWPFSISSLSHFDLNSFYYMRKYYRKKPKATVMKSGVLSPFFNLSGGTRQGYSLHQLLTVVKVVDAVVMTPSL